ncbi:FMRFamide receptor [Strongyloides ratti]|uniref:FMRFamide receptor n=1 Tax=Strongyloides ratti TaxID=34506 RepID=A0A090KU94_STRRB|nr:FMRFamide receptor [Strongyloides ratti]CEF59435.1 FMRFamide receptor [Strongyloides ratti]
MAFVKEENLSLIIGSEMFCKEKVNSMSTSSNEIQNIIYLYTLPIIGTFGILAAIICVIVFTRPQMKCSLNVYLAAGCTSQGSVEVCRIFAKLTLIFYPISLMAQVASVYTCVAITVDRFLAVKYPLKMRMWCSSRKATIIVICIGIASIIFKIPSYLENTLGECGLYVQTSFAKNKYYYAFYHLYGQLFYLFIIPWAIMIVLNVTVVYEVHTAYKIRQSLGTRQNSVDEGERRCTIMAASVLLTFMVFNLPTILNSFIDVYYGVSKKVTFFDKARVPVANMFICFNSASNLIIYSIFGRKFRRVCVKLVFPCFKRTEYHFLTQVVQQSDCNEMSKKYSQTINKKNSISNERQNSVRLVCYREKKSLCLKDENKRMSENSILQLQITNTAPVSLN